MNSSRTIDPRERLVVVTGVGYRTGNDLAPTTNIYEAPAVKVNMGAATALRAVQDGYSAVLVGRAEEKLQRIQDSIRMTIADAEVSYVIADLLCAQDVTRLANTVGDASHHVDLVQSLGLSAGAYRIADDNPYLRVNELPSDLPTVEFDTVVRGLLLLVQSFLPLWQRQPETRLVVINSMSGIRPYMRGYAHASAKAGLHHAVRSLALELAKSNIFVSEVNPGAVDTGFYDSPKVQEAVAEIGREFGYDYSSGIPQMPPSSVADAVSLCLRSEAHILSINAVARGQFPQHGA